MGELELIRAGEEHVSLLCEFFCDLHKTHVTLRPDFFASITEKENIAEKIREMILSKQRLFLLACVEGKMCAYLEGSLAKTNENEVLYTPRRFARIENLYTVPACRKKGYARALISHFTTYVAELGFPSIELDVLAANEEAVEFYRALGFCVQKCTMEKMIKK